MASGKLDSISKYEEKYTSLLQHYCMDLLQLNIGQLGLPDIGHDLNVEPVWIQGITGCNSIVAIVDDGKTLACEQCSIPFRQQEHSAATYKCVDKL